MITCQAGDQRPSGRHQSSHLRAPVPVTGPAKKETFPPGRAPRVTWLMIPRARRTHADKPTHVFTRVATLPRTTLTRSPSHPRAQCHVHVPLVSSLFV